LKATGAQLTNIYEVLDGAEYHGKPAHLPAMDAFAPAPHIAIADRPPMLAIQDVHSSPEVEPRARPQFQAVPIEDSEVSFAHIRAKARAQLAEFNAIWDDDEDTIPILDDAEDVIVIAGSSPAKECRIDLNRDVGTFLGAQVDPHSCPLLSGSCEPPSRSHTLLLHSYMCVFKNPGKHKCESPHPCLYEHSLVLHIHTCLHAGLIKYKGIRLPKF
jgi:hypothetical protein